VFATSNVVPARYGESVLMLDEIRAAARKQVLYLPHAIRQMARADRMITTLEVDAVIGSGTIIEDYPDDPRGHSALLLGFGEEGRAVHCYARRRWTTSRSSRRTCPIRCDGATTSGVDADARVRALQG
jgi:hypothetical protein